MAAGALALVLVIVSLPPRAADATTRARGGEWGPRVRGAFHVHTTRSDGTGHVEEVARAAGDARLDFVVLTDHGDGTRTPDPPRYVGNVLVLDGVEVSTRLGHYAVVGLRGPTPYRLAGWPDEVIEDVERWGGAAFVTHPDSPRRSLSWRDWDAPVHGFEWLNADTEWRNESRLTLTRALAAYWVRPVEVLASLFERPTQTLERWDRLSSDGRFLVTIAGADAHARLGLREDDGTEGGSWALRVPGYAQVFRSFSTVAELDAPFEARALPDARRLIDAIARGRTYTVIDGYARRGRLSFSANHGNVTARMGDLLPPGVDATFRAHVSAPAGSEVRLLRNGVPVASTTGLELAVPIRTALRSGERGAAYRVEVMAPSGGRAPWMLSNAIFVGDLAAARDRVTQGEADGSGGGTDAENDDAGIDLRSCAVEKDATSRAERRVEASGDQLQLDYRLADAPTSWVALACEVPGEPMGGRTLNVTLDATRPMRLSVQLRGASSEARWSRSVYVDERSRRVRIPFDTFRPVASGVPDRLPAGPVALLLVIDRTHGVPGMNGLLRVQRARLGGAAAAQVRTVSSR